jgi:hypothetical protein
LQPEIQPLPSLIAAPASGQSCVSLTLTVTLMTTCRTECYPLAHTLRIYRRLSHPL